MQIERSAISLNVPDPSESATFVERWFGFQRQMEADGFVSLARAEAGFNLIFLRTGLATFKPASHRGAAGDGLLIVFEVADIDADWERMQGHGLTFPTPIETEPWGERFFQVLDPNGIIFQLVQWV